MPSAAQGSVLSLENIDKTYGRSAKPALDRVSFDVAPGEFFSILGPSGSGKTTILRTIAGFEQPDFGRVVMAGEVVTHIPPNRRDVRTVFQSYALFPHMTVAENVQYPLRMQRMARAERTARAGDALELVAMGGFASRLPHELSGGQRQRVALARAIVSRPKIVLLDEPLGALDLRLRQQMQHTLVALQKELRMAFVYVTHDQGEALSMSDRVLVMQEGRIAQIGKPQDLYFAPKSEFVARFVGNSNMLPMRFASDGRSCVANIGGVNFPELTGNDPRAAIIAVRYDDVAVSEAGSMPGPAPVLKGVVENVLFLGTNFEVNVRCGDLRIMSSIPATQTARLVSGQSVDVSFDLSRAQVFHV
ncbi:ABC transporter ATP-binding protein [Labrys monachus]|uniref:Spermidine/putrescine transport system ATP-binding protein n=1 Tax=Labrys monachus TaxID=217067 RepID=A0ABU0F880_9HYPH|nr:ABC transporter ATP-binding protein [Labrys monachus]MDQ0390255.1 spermidine/putrescine transport system ATP-binding protein [Labrys monachus]